MKVSALLVLVLAIYSVSGQMMWNRLSGMSNNPETPAPRTRHAMGYCDSTQEVIVFSGRTSSGLSNETWTYDTVDDTWTDRTNTSGLPPPPRLDSYYGVIQALDIFVVAYGTGSVEYDDVWVFHCMGRNWEQLTVGGNAPPIRYGGHFGTWWSDAETSLWMGGGFTETTGLYPSRYIDTYRLNFSNPSTAAWELLFANPSSGNQFNPLVPHGRCLQGSAVVSRNNLVLFGGCLKYVLYTISYTVSLTNLSKHCFCIAMQWSYTMHHDGTNCKLLALCCSLQSFHYFLWFKS